LKKPFNTLPQVVDIPSHRPRQSSRHYGYEMDMLVLLARLWSYNKLKKGHDISKSHVVLPLRAVCLVIVISHKQEKSISLVYVPE
jgi:hypothetical protein